MICTVLLTITVLSKTFTVERQYTGRMLAAGERAYIVDFSDQTPWLDKPLLVPRKDCEKAP